MGPVKLVVRSPEELLAAVPHMLGFQPEESVVLVPFRQGLPSLRVDLPTTTQARADVWEAIHEGLYRHVHPGAQVALICFTPDDASAERASRHLTAHLETIGVTTQLRLHAHADTWRDLDTGRTGSLATSATDRLAAQMVLAGAAQPVSSRQALAASLVGDRDPVAKVLTGVRAAASKNTVLAERSWAHAQLQQFHVDGNRLSDTDSARMLVAVEDIGTRDVLWSNMTRQNAPSHVALWSDLTRRAPDSVRAAPSMLLAFSSWLRGDGARAWCALDQIPPGPPYSMAALVASVLEHGLHPREWERLNTQMRDAATDIDESVAHPWPCRHEREVPRSEPTSYRRGHSR
ncbi:DUF4192 domain-containing protein [Nocardioides zeicaulis]|uniref:DUF4192 domain-containing protein n=1 Tax=Nocardioides zeicaulis TaxID=1776857 RepID=A0ABV6DWU0_9ACTN